MKTLIFVVLLLTLSIKTFAHGEHEPGPNGGVIRMPGAYHTEVLVTKGGYKVYLLDLEFKNPTTEGNVVLNLSEGKKIECKKENDHFFCPIQKPIKKEFKIESVRKNIKGEDATYPANLK